MESTLERERSGLSYGTQPEEAAGVVALNQRPFLALAGLWFVTAAIAGTILRFGQLVGMPFGWNYNHLRHAHSHLMYFGWVTPALMALIYGALPAVTGRDLPRPRLARWQLAATTLAAILTFPAFATSGYGLTRIGNSEVPLSIITAMLNILTWYAFAGVYWHASRGTERSLALRAFDGAVIFLVLSSLGAWSIGALTGMGIQSFFLNSAAVHLFLDLFSDGWFILGTLGLLLTRIGEGAESDDARWPLWLVIAGLTPTFLLAIPVSLIPPALRFAAGLGGLVVAVGLSLLAWWLWGARSRLPRIVPAALVCLAIKAVAEGLLAFPGFAKWAAGTQLRLFYLHALLLGFVTLTLVGLAGDKLNLRGRLRRWGENLLTASVGVTLAALFGVALVHWLPFGPRPLLWMATWSSVAVLIAMAGFFVDVIRAREPRTTT